MNSKLNEYLDLIVIVLVYLNLENLISLIESIKNAVFSRHRFSLEEASVVIEPIYKLFYFGHNLK